MDTNQVVQKIISEAQAKANQIKAEADIKINALKAQADNELSQFQLETQRLSQKALSESKDRILAAARMAASKMETETKRMLLNRVIEKTADNIKSMKDDQYLNLMEGLIIASVKTGNEELIVGKNEKRINDGFVAKINQKLGDKGKIKISPEKTDIDAGFILRQGKSQVNASIDVMLKVAAQRLEGKLAIQLFGK